MFEFNPERSDTELITGFLTSVKTMLVTIVERGYEPLAKQRTGLELNPDLREAAHAALQELIEQRQFERALSAVETAPQEVLDFHGVTGAQLHFKLAGVREREERFRLSPWLWSLRRFFDAIDNLLKSILTALGASEAMTEFKDAIFAATEDENVPG